MPVSKLVSAAVSFSLVLNGVRFIYFTSDKAYERADTSQGDVGRRQESAVYSDSRILRA